MRANNILGAYFVFNVHQVGQMVVVTGKINNNILINSII